MAKVTQFIINITEDDNGQITVDNSFMVDGKEATFSDVSLDDKYNMVQALKCSLGTLARITMIEMQAARKTIKSIAEQVEENMDKRGWLGRWS